MWDKMVEGWDSFKIWLNQHPLVKGALVISESTAVATLVNVFQTGGIQLTKQGLYNLGVAVVGAVYLSLQNYFRKQAVSVKKP